MTNFVSDRALALFSIIRLVAPQHLRRLPGQPRHRRRPGLVSVADPRDAELGEFLVGRGPLAAQYIHRQRRALADRADTRSEEHTSELQSLMRISYAVFCLKKKNARSPTTSDPTSHKKTTNQ